jgi:hypothetical protein
VGMLWLSGDVVAQLGMWWFSWGCGGSVGDVVAQLGCGGSVGMWWLSGDAVAQWGCGGSVGMWWLSGLGCGGSVVRDVVAQWISQLGETRLSRSSPEFESGFTQSLLNGARKNFCVL